MPNQYIFILLNDIFVNKIFILWVLQVHLRRSEMGFGITLTGDRPARVLTVLPGSPAQRFGIIPHDIILRIDDCDVSNFSSDTVARAIRFCESHMKMCVRRQKLPVVMSPNGNNNSLVTPNIPNKPCPPERHASKTSALLRDTIAKHGGGNNNVNGANKELFPWQQLQHGSLESRSRTSEGDSLGTSEISGDADADNSYLDMRAHWALMKSPV